MAEGIVTPLLTAKSGAAGDSTSAPPPERTVEIVARELAAKHDYDIFLYNGPISEPMYSKVVSNIVRKKRNRVLVILVTLGGYANPAYRIARLLQSTCARFTILVPSYCKSAGTLVVTGAHELWMSVFAELGPLDVQLVKWDEIGEQRSGLTTQSALEGIKAQAFEMFSDGMMEIKRRSGNRVRFRTAADLAMQMTTGLFSHIYSQIDPLSMGEDYRDLHVALEYGERLAKYSRNLKPGGVTDLVHKYPSHDFVIDLEEAKELFRTVNRPPSEFYELLGLLNEQAMKPLTEDDGVFRFLSEEPEQTSATDVSYPATEAAKNEGPDDAAVEPSTEAAVAQR